ncbi:MAG TPA: TonB-dependent receptor [Terriglobia bacterium]|nr:TonB-dependent receptor [Terriglobia bacterium]
MRLLRHAALIVPLLAAQMALTESAVGAQQTVNYASLSGRVMDPLNARVAGADVSARETETGVVSGAKTDADGRFRFAYLKPGPYEIEVRAAGFTTFKRALTLTVGSSAELVAELGLSTVETTIRVSGQPEGLETGRTQIAGTVPEREIRDLPVSGRSILDAALLVPGVSPTNTASTQLFAETSAVPGQGLSINSQRNFSNSFIVDGLSANDDAAGLSGVFYGYDAISEFQVVTSGGQAEFGRALGGYMNVITRSGANMVHGDLYGYFRNQRFNAANPLSQTTLPLTQAQYGGTLGGPIVPNRTFYFANFEQRILNQSGLTTITPANVSAINTRLAAVGYPGPAVSTGVYPNPVHATTGLGKIDHNFGANDQFTIRYSVYDLTSANSRGAGGLSAPSASSGLDNTDHTIAISNIATLSPRLVNETRAQFTHSNLLALPTDLTGPAVSISGVGSFGRLSSSPTGRLNTLFEVVDNVAYNSGPHSVRIGVNFLNNQTTITFPRSVRGSYSFSSLTNFLNGVYNNSGFTQTFNDTAVSQNNPNIGLYVQDQWNALPNLTLSFGARYDLQFLETIETDTNNVSPRVGFAWTPLASRRTVVRGSYGLFYDRVPLRALANALLSAGNTTDVANLRQVSLSLSPGQTGAPAFPDILSSLTLPAGVLFNFTTMDQHIQNAYSQQISLEIERELDRNTTVRIGYQHVRGLHLVVSVNQNVPTCVASGNNNGCRPNPNYANNSEYSSEADSFYDGMSVSFVQRPSRWGSYRISYTYSKALDNVGEFFFSSPIDHYNIWQDYGRSDDDQRHRFVIDGTIQAPIETPRNFLERVARGFALSMLLQYYSALPFNITAGTTTIQGTTARPTINGAYIPRNAGEGFDHFNVNARLSRTFHTNEDIRIETTVEAFNILNHVNGVARNGSFGNGAYPTAPASTFNQTTAVADPRTLQFGLRMSF